jgi:demethylmenaquinone methyltransferase/2-methoxy-6-polyprenyl-1,4-benzoquinol methylase
MSERIISDQIDYYRARAGEYDEWFLRQGRFDHGRDFNRRWFEQVDQVRAALDTFAPCGDVLELACGTGLWTERLAPHATQLTAVDAAPEVIEINRRRVNAQNVTYEQADLFAWQPSKRYDVIFFSFWLSHVPPDRFEIFWHKVRSCLKDDGRFFLVDSLYNHTTTANNHVLLGRDSTVQERKLNDGRSYQIVKIYYEPEDLAVRLDQLAWHSDLKRSADYFLYGSGKPK